MKSTITELAMAKNKQSTRPEPSLTFRKVVAGGSLHNRSSRLRHVWSLITFLLGLEVSQCLAAEDVIPQMLESDVKHVVVCRASSGRYAMYGGLTRLPDGEILCVYKVGSRDPTTGSPWTVRDEEIVWTRSSSKGHSWPGKGHLIYKNPAGRQENCPGKGYLARDGRLLHPFYTVNLDRTEKTPPESYWSKLHLAESKDVGKTWDIRTVASMTPYGGIVPLKNGTLLLLAYSRPDPKILRSQSGILRSTDDGNTFTDYKVIGAGADSDGGPARLNETDIAELPSGKLVSISRSQYNDYPLYQGVSSDKGLTWKVERNGLSGICPSLCFTESGPPEGMLTLIYHDRWGKHASHEEGMYVVFSSDEGETWGEPVWIDKGGYPCIIEIAPGQMFTTYYQSFGLLRGAFFSVPFPSGLRTWQPDSETDTVMIAWDTYRGKKASDYTYHVHRSASPDSSPTDETSIGSVQSTNSFLDKGTKSEKTYFYEVVAREGERRVGCSWIACATLAEKRQEGRRGKL